MANSEEMLEPTEVNGIRRVIVRKASLYHRVPKSLLEFLNSNSFDNFLHAEFKITKKGKHVVTLREAGED